jgi:hypothetical protein
MGQNTKFLKQHYDVRFEVLMVTSMKMVMITLMMEAVSSSKMSIIIYQTARHYIPEDGHLQAG